MADNSENEEIKATPKKKNLSYFMRSKEPEIVTAPGPDTFRDENGNVIDFQIKVLPQAEITRINDMYRKKTMATDKKGNPLVANGECIWKIEKDNGRATRHLVVEALQYPDLKDKELMDYYGCVDITEMPNLVFTRADEYQHVLNIVLQALGLAASLEDADDEKEVLDTAKN